eukprot:jgi/Mesvir1/17896/Mv25370-RA.1
MWQKRRNYPFQVLDAIWRASASWAGVQGDISCRAPRWLKPAGFAAQNHRCSCLSRAWQNPWCCFPKRGLSFGATHTRASLHPAERLSLPPSCNLGGTLLYGRMRSLAGRADAQSSPAVAPYSGGRAPPPMGWQHSHAIASAEQPRAYSTGVLAAGTDRVHRPRTPPKGGPTRWSAPEARLLSLATKGQVSELTRLLAAATSPSSSSSSLPSTSSFSSPSSPSFPSSSSSPSSSSTWASSSPPSCSPASSSLPSPSRSADQGDRPTIGLACTLKATEVLLAAGRREAALTVLEYAATLHTSPPAPQNASQHAREPAGAAQPARDGGASALAPHGAPTLRTALTTNGMLPLAHVTPPPLEVRAPRALVHGFQALLTLCGRAGDVALSLRVMASMRAAGIRTSQVAYASAFRACATGGDLATATALFAGTVGTAPHGGNTEHGDGMGEGGPHHAATNTPAMTPGTGVVAAPSERSTVPVGAALAGAHLSTAPRQARPARQPRHPPLRPDLVTYNALIHACAPSGDVTTACAALRMLLGERVTDDDGPARGVHPRYPARGGRPQQGIPHRDTRSTSPAPPSSTPLTPSPSPSTTPTTPKHLVPDIKTVTSLLAVCVGAGDLPRARQVVALMPRWRLSHDAMSMSALVAVHARAGDVEGAFRTVEDMRAMGLAPVAHTYSSLIMACAHKGDVDRGFAVLDQMLAGRAARVGGAGPTGRPAPATGGKVAAINAVPGTESVWPSSPAGSVPSSAAEASAHVWTETSADASATRSDPSPPSTAATAPPPLSPLVHLPDVVLYNSLLSACWRVGDGARAQAVMERMLAEGLRPDAVAMETLARAWARAGDVSKALAVVQGTRGGDRPSLLCGLVIHECQLRGDHVGVLRVMAALREWGLATGLDAATWATVLKVCRVLTQRAGAGRGELVARAELEADAAVSDAGDRLDGDTWQLIDAIRGLRKGLGKEQVTDKDRPDT